MKASGTRKKETNGQLRKRLINDAIDLDMEVTFLEGQIGDLLSQIKELNPTKKELKNGLQDLMNCYY